MDAHLMAHRLPIESSRPLVAFATARLALVVVSLVAALATGLAYGGRLPLALAGLALPWAVLSLLLARRRPRAAMSPLVAGGDFLVLAAIELAVPETYGAVRVAAVFLIAAHAHFLGERLGLATAALAALALVASTTVRQDAPIRGELLAFYESVFVASALVTGFLVGWLRTAESASRLRARGLSRRTIQAEDEIRRRIAEAMHDGPVQELIGLEMVIASARHAAEQGDSARADRLLAEAREVTSRNVRLLRDEIVSLGPYAFEELTLEAAAENCMPVWKRRYGFEVLLSLEPVDIPAEVAGDLFRILQEAVANAGRHAEAETVSIWLRRLDGDLELGVSDDGRGFQGSDPLAPGEPGHLGLASIRERAELIDGELRVESSERGTRLVVRAPLPR